MAAVTRVVKAEHWGPRWDHEGHREAGQTYIVVTDSPLVDGYQVLYLAHLQLPHVGDFYQNPDNGVSDTAMLCREVTPRLMDRDSPTVWEVELLYSTRTADIQLTGATGLPGLPSGGGGGGGGPQDDYTVLEPKVRWSFTDQTEDFYFDYDGNPVETKAGEAFDPVPTQTVKLLTLNVVQAEADFDPLFAKTVIDSTNSDTFFGSAAGHALCTDYSGESQFVKGRGVWWVHYQFIFDDRTNVNFEFVKLPHKGTQYKVLGPPAKVVKAKDENDNIIMVNLDNDGSKLADGAPCLPIPFKRRAKIAFGGLPIRWAAGEGP